MQPLQSIPNVGNVPADRFFLIAGPCAVEGREVVFEIAERVSGICGRLGIPYIFKASYDKANRSRLDSFRSIGKEKAMGILGEVRGRLSLPVLTDIHQPSEAARAAEVADILQIPAFLCRQTDLLLAAGETGKVVNIKKGQFLSAESMRYAVDKVRSVSDAPVFLTERGTTFGYGDLVVDFRNIPLMRRLAPTVLDCTHSVQRPNSPSGVTGGRPEMVATLAKAGIAAGVDGIFIETHPEPSKALSDGTNMLPLDDLEELLSCLLSLKMAIFQC